jgi:hypothetical protein
MKIPRFSNDALGEIFTTVVARSPDRAALWTSIALVTPTSVRPLKPTIRTADNYAAQLKIDLDVLNTTGQLEDGTDPFQQWLRNAVHVTTPHPASQTLQRHLTALIADASQPADGSGEKEQSSTRNVERKPLPLHKLSGWTITALGGAAILVVILMVFYKSRAKPPILVPPASWEGREDDGVVDIDDSLFTISGVSGRFDLYLEGSVAICHAAYGQDQKCPISSAKLSSPSWIRLDIEYRVRSAGSEPYQRQLCRAEVDPSKAAVPTGRRHVYVDLKPSCRVSEVALKSGERLEVRVDTDTSECRFGEEKRPCRAVVNSDDPVFQFYLVER